MKDNIEKDKKPLHTISGELIKYLNQHTLSKLEKKDHDLFQTLAESLQYIEETILKREQEFDRLNDLSERQLANLRNLNRALKDSMDEFQLIYKNEAVMNSISDIRQLLELFCSAVKGVVDYQAAGVYLVNTENRKFELAFSADLSEENKALIEQKIESGTFAWVLKEAHSSVVPAESVEQGTDAEENMILVPMITDNFRTGVTVLLTPAGIAEFTPQIFRLLETLSSHYAVYVELATQHESLARERKELETMHNYLDRILENLSVGIIVLDEHQKISVINRAAEMIFDIKADEERGRSLEHVFSGETLNDFQQVLERVWEGETVIDYETSFEHTGGVVFDLALTPSVVRDKNKRPMGTVIICRDLFTSEEMNRLLQNEETRRAELKDLHEELLRTRDTLVRADRLTGIGKMAAGMAHEINNPLGTISGYIQMLQMEIGEQGEQSDYLKFIKSEVERIREIVKKMLDFARYKSETGTDEFVAVDVNETLNTTIDLMDKQIRDSHTSVEKELTGEPTVIQGAQPELQQIFINLILNALQAMENGGELRISTQAYELEDTVKKDWAKQAQTRKLSDADGIVVIQFADTGTGIRKESLKHLFEPFYTTKEQGQGSGLGLSVTYGIVERHGGTIDVKSEWRRGSTFTIKLPLSGNAV